MSSPFSFNPCRSKSIELSGRVSSGFVTAIECLKLKYSLPAPSIAESISCANSAASKSRLCLTYKCRSSEQLDNFHCGMNACKLNSLFTTDLRIWVDDSSSLSSTSLRSKDQAISEALFRCGKSAKSFSCNQSQASVGFSSAVRTQAAAKLSNIGKTLVANPLASLRAAVNKPQLAKTIDNSCGPALRNECISLRCSDNFIRASVCNISILMCLISRTTT
ncbi:hypothetical protein FF38_13797 [Lucilia cuprina]|uniref:Uncharacterized protein n=1 Tax=Lucilia cuprina TaxID=7375 RepID=A0A0L0C976_LUCCU|nr:hypothetical protein FF38_13797 [Lucilia cuprina]